ncbi:hypothetical protein COHA_004318 [Chlorella ohadii]|uniref:Uncharacterized protein n=1 Tax=Chlorella ohadii TaxID=2649997 RepID=A0AAD5DS38_9CHLO|nr:hypothetical protein COHA_004318 [Chlorella ohadii]
MFAVWCWIGCREADEQEARGMAGWASDKAQEVARGVKDKIGSEWGGKKVEEAEMAMPGGAGEIEYVRVRASGAKEGEGGWEAAHPDT